MIAFFVEFRSEHDLLPGLKPEFNLIFGIKKSLKKLKHFLTGFPSGFGCYC